ncbi:MAG: orotidine-5'-phosphate decarboxylase [Betaproteobacteria bacterium]|nr:orotidine-5'-phosphate decarboxylase [Betaproteobacteria bacterium]
MSDPRVIVALDYPDAAGALKLASRLDPGLCRLKVGKELYTAAGPDLVEKLRRSGFAIFLDLKYHDIPTTVAGACLAAAELGVWMIDVHALGGRAMMETARAALSRRRAPPQLVAVTLLTSIGAADMKEIGLAGDPQETVVRLARLAQACGLDGVVCSAEEAEPLRRQCGTEFCLVTPGIRPAASARDDQQRVATPRQAIASGADFLVIGRPITRAPDPLAALRAVHEEIAR